MSFVSRRNRLFKLIDQVINDFNFTKLPDFIDELNKNVDCFENLLINEPRKKEDRTLVENANKNSISIEGISQNLILSKEFIDESLIISDLFEVNELVAVDMLLAGEADCTTKTEFTRGLMTVINYYQNQLNTINSLKTLHQAKYGIEPVSPEALEARKFVENYITRIYKNNLFSKIIKLLKSFDLKKDTEKLESQRALGSSKHRRMFINIYNSIRSSLSECLLYRVISSYSPTKEEIIDLFALIDYLYNDENENIKKENDENYFYQPYNESHRIDSTFLNLLTCLFGSLSIKLDKDINDSENESISLLINSKSQIDLLNLFKSKMESTITPIFKRDMDYQTSMIGQLYKLIYLNWVINMQKISQMKQNQFISINSFDDDDDIADLESGNVTLDLIFDAFTFLIQIIHSTDNFHQNISWITCIHNFVTDYIIYLPRHLKEMYKPNELYFVSLLELISCLYTKKDDCKLDFESNNEDGKYVENLVLSYWSIHELRSTCNNNTQVAIEEYTRNWSLNYEESSRNSVLFKFLRDAGDLVQNEKVYISYVSMLRGLCLGEKSAFLIFSLLNNSSIVVSRGNVGQVTSVRLSWDWFIDCLCRHGNHWSNPALSDNLQMSLEESEAMLVVIQLIRQVCQYNRTVRLHLLRGDYSSTDSPSQLANSLIQLLICRNLSFKLKSEIILCLNSFCLENEVVLQIWQLIDGGTSSPNSPISLLEIDIDVIESRHERYIVARSYLILLSTLVTQITALVNVKTNVALSELNSLKCRINNMIKIIFLKHTMRSYVDPYEKWIICQGSLRVIIECVRLFVSKVFVVGVDNTNKAPSITSSQFSWCYCDPGYMLVSQLLSDTPLLQMILSLLEHGHELINDTLNNQANQTHCNVVKSCINTALDLIWFLVSVESNITTLIKDLVSDSRSNSLYRNSVLDSKPVIIDRLSKLLVSIKPNYQFLITLLNYVDIIDDCEKIGRRALSIFTSSVSVVQPHSNLLLMLTNKQTTTRLDIMSSLVNCLDKHGIWDEFLLASLDQPSSITDNSPNISSVFQLLLTSTQRRVHMYLDSARSSVLQLLVQSLESDSSPNLAQYLLGFSITSEKQLRHSSLQEPGLGGSYASKTCLHSLLGLASGLQKELQNSPCATPAYNSIHLTDLIQCMFDLNQIYRIFYLLASNSNTGPEFLRFIRNNYQFTFNQLDLISYPSTKLADFPELQTLLWSQKAWLLNIMAIEIRLCWNNQQKKYVNELIKVLFGDEAVSSEVHFTTSRIFESNHNNHLDPLIYEILEDIHLEEPEDVVDFGSASGKFKSEVLKEYLRKCVERSLYGRADLIDGYLLKELIETDVNLVAHQQQNSLSTTLPQINHFPYNHPYYSSIGAGDSSTNTTSYSNSHWLILQESNLIGQMVFRFNRAAMRFMDGKLKILEAWQSLIEVSLMTIGSDGSLTHTLDPLVNSMSSRESQGKIQKKFVAQLMKICLEKILTPSSPSNLLRPLGSVCLSLSYLLTQLIIPSNQYLDTMTTGASNSTSTACHYVSSLTNNFYGLSHTFSQSELEEIELILRILIKLLTECCIKINYKLQKSRIKFYASLTLLLQIVIRLQSNYPETFNSLFNDCFYGKLNMMSCNNGMGSGTLGSNTDQHHHHHQQRDSSNNLYSIVCTDIMSGNTHLVLSSLAVLKCLICIDRGDGQLVQFLVVNGYVQSLIESVIRDCSELSMKVRHSDDEVHQNRDTTSNFERVSVDSITDSPAFYTYQAKMMLLSHLAARSHGSHALVQAHILAALSKSPLFKHRPNSTNIMDTRSFLSNYNTTSNVATNIYSELMRPLLQLSTTLLSSTSDSSTNHERPTKEVMNLLNEFSNHLIGPGLLANRNSLMNPDLSLELLQLTDLLILLLPAIFVNEHLKEFEQKLGLLEELRHGVSLCISFLLDIELSNQDRVLDCNWSLTSANDRAELVRDSQQQLIHTQILSNLLIVIQQINHFNSFESSINSSQRNIHMKLPGFFSANVDGVSNLTSSSNYHRQSQIITKLSQSIMAGNKCPLSLLVFTIMCMKRQMEQIDSKLTNYSRISRSSNLQLCRMTNNLNELEEDMSKLTLDQLWELWINVFNESSGGKSRTNNVLINSDDRLLPPMLSLDTRNTSTNCRAALITDLVQLYQQIINTTSSLIGGCEAACYMLWNCLELIKTDPIRIADSSTHNLIGSKSHPMIELHNKSLIVAQSPKNLGSTSSGDEVIQVIARFMDEASLNTLQTLIQKYSGSEEDASFSKGVIHRLNRILKLTTGS